MTTLAPTLSLEELSNGYCLLMANAYRLIEDGEILSQSKRFVGATGLFRESVNEIVKGHLVRKAVEFSESDQEKWRWFWKVFDDRREKVKVLETEIHEKIYKNLGAQSRFEKAIQVLNTDFTSVTFSEKTAIFDPPGGGVFVKDNEKEAAKAMYEYALGLFNAYNFYGLPNPPSQLKDFQTIRMTMTSSR